MWFVEDPRPPWWFLLLLSSFTLWMVLMSGVSHP